MNSECDHIPPGPAQSLTMNILAIDPGSEESGWVRITAGHAIVDHGIDDNELMLEMLRSERMADMLVTEYMEPQGLPMSKQSMRTLWWIGRFREAWGRPKLYQEVTRRQVKSHICQSQRARDSNIRQALIDRYPASGGGKTPQIGTKSQPGPLLGMTSHCWAALAVGITYLETMAREKAA